MLGLQEIADTEAGNLLLQVSLPSQLSSSWTPLLGAVSEPSRNRLGTFSQVLLDFQLDGHRQFLEHFVVLFRSLDTAGRRECRRALSPVSFSEPSRNLPVGRGVLDEDAYREPDAGTRLHTPTSVR